MILIQQSENQLLEYSQHLKLLDAGDRRSRFGFEITDYAIDQLMLRIAYYPKDHKLWCALSNNEIVAWGHMAKTSSDSVYELAVSVDKQFQRKGIASKLIKEMLEWAKFNHVEKVFMHCIEENKVIQHLALKHNLTTRERLTGERTAAIELSRPSWIEASNQLWKEHAQLLEDFAQLRYKMHQLWKDSFLQ